MPYRIDLHIHTKPSKLDSSFDFSIDALKRHVESSKLSAIAITNHNFFDRDNYVFVRDTLTDVLVLPGVEVSVKSYHVLYIASPDEVDSLANKCTALKDVEQGARGIELSDFIETFCDGVGLVIPHYCKDPSIGDEDLEVLMPYVGALEVPNVKKWARVYEDQGVTKPVVMFSDFHACDGVDTRSLGRYTYADYDGKTYSSLCLAFKDKARFSITESGEGFELAPGLIASEKLNVVFGARSSGKTYLLKRIAATYDPSDVMHIEQFEIVQNAEESRFDEVLAGEASKERKEYLHELSELIGYVSGLPTRQECHERVSKYLKSLKTYADTTAREDTYSKCPLFMPSQLSVTSVEPLVKVIEAIITLLDGNPMSDEIERHLGKQALIDLLKIAIARYKVEAISARCKNEANAIAKDIKEQLTVKSSRPACPSADFDDIAERVVAIERLASFRDAIDLPKEISSRKVGAFTRKVNRVPFKNVTGLKKAIDTRESLSGMLELPSEQFVERLLMISCTCPESAFFGIDVTLKNETGQDVSGGQRAEYLLLKKIEDAKAYGLVLIDEPESSFDNPFLNEEVNSLIKRIAENSTVFVTTHNNTLGVSIGANGLVYTTVDKAGVHDIYCGSATADELVSASGEKVRREEVLLKHMEADEDAYKGRAPYYGYSFN